MILKFDMSKAYDRLECRFLLRALRAMGFKTSCTELYVMCGIKLQ